MIKQIAIKLGLWQEIPMNTTVTIPISQLAVSPCGHDESLWKEMFKHYCAPCERWFADVRGKLMHDRHGKHNA